VSEVLSVHPVHPDSGLLDRAAGLLREGKLVVFPTETVYGIGAHRNDPRAMERLVRLKGSASARPFTVHLARAEEAARYVARPSWQARRLMERYWPGPLTLVLPTDTGEEIGLRVPAGRIASELIERSGVPVVASSANRSGRPPACSAAEASDAVGDEVDLVLDGGPTPLRESSTVVRLTFRGPELLRAGIITEEQLLRAASRLVLFVCTGNSCRSPMAQAIMQRELAAALGISERELLRRGYRALSAGLAGFGGGASSGAIEAVRRYGCDLTDHRVRMVSSELLREAERIYVMTRMHYSQIVETAPEAIRRLDLLDPEGTDIFDPIAGAQGDYDRCAEHIVRCVKQRTGELLREPA
jgi:protein-tyrosine phosphatase